MTEIEIHITNGVPTAYSIAFQNSLSIIAQVHSNNNNDLQVHTK